MNAKELIEKNIQEVKNEDGTITTKIDIDTISNEINNLVENEKKESWRLATNKYKNKLETKTESLTSDLNQYQGIEKDLQDVKGNLNTLTTQLNNERFVNRALQEGVSQSVIDNLIMLGGDLSKINLDNFKPSATFDVKTEEKEVAEVEEPSMFSVESLTASQEKLK